MPEFVLDHGSPEASKRFKALDYFTRGFIEAMFFTETGTGDDAERDLENASVAELSEEAWQRIESECRIFQGDCADLLEIAYDAGDYDSEQAGRDFWFTTNGHGIGFWARGELERDGIGQRLSDVTPRCELTLYRGDDGLLYLA